MQLVNNLGHSRMFFMYCALSLFNLGSVSDDSESNLNVQSQSTSWDQALQFMINFALKFLVFWWSVSWTDVIICQNFYIAVHVLTQCHDNYGILTDQRDWFCMNVVYIHVTLLLLMPSKIYLSAIINFWTMDIIIIWLSIKIISIIIILW